MKGMVLYFMKILYKTVCVLIALAVVPTVIYGNMVKLVVTSEMSMLIGNDSPIINDSYSLRDVYEMVQNSGSKDNARMSLKELIAEIPDSIKAPVKDKFIVFISLFLLAVLISLFVIIAAITAKTKKPVLLAAAAGLVASIASNAAFKAFAEPFTSGVVPVQDIMQSKLFTAVSGSNLMGSLGSLFSSLLQQLTGGSGRMITIKLLSMGSVYPLMLLIYTAAILWSVAYLLIDWE